MLSRFTIASALLILLARPLAHARERDYLQRGEKNSPQIIRLSTTEQFVTCWLVAGAKT